jgi:secreted PhoX family phosphatase
MRKRRTAALIGALVITASTVLLITNAAAVPNVQSYAVGIAEGYETEAWLSAGDTVLETSNPDQDYKMVGIPDGLGAHAAQGGTRIVYMNHELTNTTLSEPVVGAPFNRGAFVSKLVVSGNGQVISGERAYDWVFNENTFHGPAAQVGNSTRPFSRFCSGSLATPEEHGFDRPIYITNEEEGTPANSFDGMGGLAVAIVDNNLHTLPKLGRFSWENTLVQPTQGNRTVIMGMEDGPAVLDPAQENSQVYLYVGKKDRSHGASVLRRNGLDNGELYVLVPESSSQGSEADFLSGTIGVEWALIPNAGALNEAQLEAASDAAGAIRFARPEDGAFNNLDHNEFFFVTTGGAADANELGRLYSLQLHPGNPIKGGELTVVYNADTVIAADGDIAISPDNIDVSDDYLMINEDGTADSRQIMDEYDRDGSIWRFDLGRHGVDVSSAERIVELDPPGRDGIPVGPGVWETSGIIDGEGLFGEGTWLFDVQAHPPTTPPAPNTVEDGQLLLLTSE